MAVAGLTDTTRTYTERQETEKLYHDEKYRHNDDGGRRGRLSSASSRFWELIGEPHDLTILDFGCGNGWLSVLMAKRGNRVHGFDISGVLVEKARRFAEASQVSDRASFHEMAAEQLDFPGDTFDLIIGTSILHHTDLDVTLERIRQVLKTNGTAVFLEPLNQNIALRLWRVMTPWRRTKTERAMTKEDLATIGRVFPATRFNYYCFTSMFAEGLLLVVPGNRLLSFLHPRLEALDEVLLRWFPSLGRFSAVVVLEMKK